MMWIYFFKNCYAFLGPKINNDQNDSQTRLACKFNWNENYKLLCVMDLVFNLLNTQKINKKIQWYRQEST